MEIPFTQGAILRSQSRQRFIQDGYCDSTKTRHTQQRSTTLPRKMNIRTLPFVFLILLCLANTGHARKDHPCPDICSCTVESIVFCNNKKLTSTPEDFTSAVETLYLFNNNISRISPGTLRPLKNLKILDISGNGITNDKLWRGVFTQLKQLENLILQENQITKITNDMFTGMTNLARIYLQHNQISIIEEGSFDNLTNLVELKLRHNRLTSFPKFHNTPNLLLLDLGYNQIRFIKDMALSTVNVEQLLLQKNHLTDLRTSVFDDTSRLNHLDISQNRLTAVPQIIKSLTSLRILNMSLNRIQTIPRDTFTNLHALKSLYLRGMALKTLPPDIIPRRVILNVLDITQNDWDCGCRMRWMPRYIRRFEEAFVNSDEIKCSPKSRLRNRKVKSLTERDFECKEGDVSNGESGLGTQTTPGTLTTSSGRKTVWVPNPCDVFPCFNGGTCKVLGRHPQCKCAKYWTGTQCKQSVTISTTTTTTTPPPTTSRTTTTTTVSPAHPRPALLINPDSITEHSVEIILPVTDTDLVLTIEEVGEMQPAKEFRIRPVAHPFTVKNLESGRSYNICIHLPLNSRSRYSGRQRKDTLCGIAQTSGVRVIKTPATKPEITVVPSPGVTKVEYPTNTKVLENDAKSEPDVFNPGLDEELYGGENPETTPTEDSDFQILYPAIGAGIGGIIIIILFAMYCICRRQKRVLKLKQQNGPDYVSGSPVESNHTDMEMATVVHHHHHNHYNAGGIEPDHGPNATKKQSSPSSKPSTRQSSFANSSNKTNRTSLQNGTKILGRTNSNSSSNSSGTYDKSRHYNMPHGLQQPAHQIQYEQLPAQLNGLPNEYLYTNHQSSVPLTPQSRTHNFRIAEDAQPLVGAVNPYYGANDRHLYPVSPMNIPTYIPPYPQANSRSAFQPIQTPRSNTVLSSSSSDSMPMATRVSTAHVMPTATACLSRNLVNDNMPRYHEGVQVV